MIPSVPRDSENRTIIFVDVKDNNKEILRYYSRFVPTAYTEQIDIDGKPYTIKAVETKICTKGFFDVETIVYVEWGYYTNTRNS